MINYVSGDATIPQGQGKKLVIHVVNDLGKFGSGFALAVLKRFPIVREAYLSAFVEEPLKLGDVQFVKVTDELWYANMVGQHGMISSSNPTPIKYDSLRLCLKKVCEFATANSMNVFGPKFGSGLAGGDWRVVENIINDELVVNNVNVTIYELPK